MAYLGNSPVLSQQEYRNIDNISGSFNGVTTSFPLRVNGVAPVPAPQSSNQCLISVNGVVQKPDDSGASGFRISGGNIIFSAAPTSGQSFFGVILAGADYIYAGENFPDGTVTAPSITFKQDLGTGFYRNGAGEVRFTSSGTNAAILNSSSLTAPSFIPTSSTAPTNGVYLSAANTVAISTNGTGRLFIDSSGRVGVGSSSDPGSIGSRFWTDTSTDTWVTHNTTGSGNLTGIHFRNSNGNGEARILNNTGGALTFYRSPSSEAMRITSAGLVGVGTSSPEETLDANGAIVWRGGLNSGKTSAGALDRSGNELRIRAYGATAGTGQLVFRTGGGGGSVDTEAMRIDASQRVGIGTSSPSTLFHCAGIARIGANDANDAELQIGAGATGNRPAYIDLVGDTTYTDYGLRVIRNATGANANSLIAHRGTGDLQLNALEAGAIGLFTNDTQRLRITSAGNVGIGSATPGDFNQVVNAPHLVVGNGTTSYPGVTLYSTTAGAGIVAFADGTTGNQQYRGYIQYDQNVDQLNLGSNGPIAFNTGTERARIDSSGRLLVGTSSYSGNSKLVVNNAVSGGSEIAVFRNEINPNYGGLVISGGITDRECRLQAAYGNSFLTFYTEPSVGSAAERMRITEAGEIWINRTTRDSVVGSACKLQILGTGGEWSTIIRNSNGATPYGLYIKHDVDANTNTNSFWVGNGGGVNRGYLASNGGLYNYSGNNSNLCDEREKKNIENLESTWDCLKHWELKKFHYNEDVDTESKRYGVIAQQVEQHCPEVITEWTKGKDEDGEDILRKGVKEQQMYWMAIKALQEAQVRIEALEAEVAALKAQ